MEVDTKVIKWLPVAGREVGEGWMGAGVDARLFVVIHYMSPCILL